MFGVMRPSFFASGYKYSTHRWIKSSSAKALPSALKVEPPNTKAWVVFTK